MQEWNNNIYVFSIAFKEIGGWEKDAFLLNLRDINDHLRISVAFLQDDVIGISVLCIKERVVAVDSGTNFLYFPSTLAYEVLHNPTILDGTPTSEWNAWTVSAYMCKNKPIELIKQKGNEKILKKL